MSGTGCRLSIRLKAGLRATAIAQVQLDGALAKQGEKKILFAVERENPFSKSNARIDTQFKVGDSYTYREIEHTAAIIGDGVGSPGAGRLVNGCFPAD